MVAAAGAGPCPQITSTLPLRTSWRMTGTSPPGPFKCGSTTCNVKAVATAASKALPPFSSVAMPTAVAIQCVVVTTPKVPSISGRVVKGLGLILETMGARACCLLVIPGRKRSERTRNPSSATPGYGFRVRGQGPRPGMTSTYLPQMTGHVVPRPDLAQCRRFNPAALDRIGAAGVEMAARRRADRARHIALQHALLPLHPRIGHRHRQQ